MRLGKSQKGMFGWENAFCIEHTKCDGSARHTSGDI